MLSKRFVTKTKWIFKTKRNTNGEKVKKKSGLVAKGFTQRYGIDYEETFAPVVRYISFRLLMTLAVKNKIKIQQMEYQPILRATNGFLRRYQQSL